MKNLFISEILLMSHKEKKAKRVEFDPSRTLVLGKNQTGKSSLIKSIYRTFGANVLVNPKFDATNPISLVRFEIGGVKFEIMRDGRLYSLFNAQGELLSKFESVTNELGPHLSRLFNFRPLFQNKKGEFIIPPPAFLFLPFYVDQDDGWNKSWSSFRNLNQLKDYRTQSINYHSGVRPNEYYETRKKLDEYIQKLESTEKERALTSKILRDLNSKLSQATFNIDVDQFKEEITELLVNAQILRKKEEDLKEKLLDLYNLKSTISCQVEIVTTAIKESSKDLKFMNQQLADIVSCPTCGAEYANSFIERFEIARDEQKSRDLLLELKREALEVDQTIIKESDSLTRTLTEVQKIEALLEERKGEVMLKDVIESAGKNQVREIFSARISELVETLVENAIQKEEIETKLKGLEDKDRKKSIETFYQTKLSENLKKLDVHSLVYDDYKKLTTKIEDKETGSSRPRALIAYYYTFFELMKKYSTSTFCPIIIDSPNQQDQDVEHIDKIMEFINISQPKESQMILGLAETYDVKFNCKIVELKEKYSLLQTNEYDEVYSILSNRLEQTWFG